MEGRAGWSNTTGVVCKAGKNHCTVWCVRELTQKKALKHNRAWFGGDAESGKTCTYYYYYYYYYYHHRHYYY